MAKKLSHITATGAAHMVDVSAKKPTLRRAVAEGFVLMARETAEALRTHSGPKGEAISVARIAGILAAKKTGELIPLCHPLPVEQVTVEIEVPDYRRIPKTVEPGLYVPQDAVGVPDELRGLGIRIEDDILVTESGQENMTAACPKEISELESLIGRG